MAKWYYLVDGKEAGPIEPAELKRLADSGRIKPQDNVRRADMPQWYFAKDVTGLFAAHTQSASKAVSRPEQSVAPNSARTSELGKATANLSTVESFMWPWRRYKNRWARAAVFVACCAVAIPISKWAGGFLGTQLAALRQPRDEASLIVADTADPPAEPPAPVAPDDRNLFARGETLVFDTTGHMNANGLKMRISYPRTWKATDGAGHHVALSVVGTDRLLASGYFRAKLAQENLIKASKIPYTIVRATQFFEFVGSIAESASLPFDGEGLGEG